MPIACALSPPTTFLLPPFCTLFVLHHPLSYSSSPVELIQKARTSPTSANVAKHQRPLQIFVEGAFSFM